MSKINLANFKKALGKVNSAQAKAEETKLHITRMCEMQELVDMSDEKIQLLIDTLYSKATDCGKTLLEKGVVVFVRYIKAFDKIKETLEDRKIHVVTVNADCSAAERLKVSSEFMTDCSNTVCLISEAGSESLDLDATNEIILYDVPDGVRKYNQTIGRICRGNNDNKEFFIHFIIIKETLDEYRPVLLSSRREVGLEILGESDVIPLKETGSFNLEVLKKIRRKLLWKK